MVVQLHPGPLFEGLSLPVPDQGTKLPPKSSTIFRKRVTLAKTTKSTPQKSTAPKLTTPPDAQPPSHWCGVGGRRPRGRLQRRCERSRKLKEGSNVPNLPRPYKWLTWVIVTLQCRVEPLVGQESSGFQFLTTPFSTVYCMECGHSSWHSVLVRSDA